MDKYFHDLWRNDDSENYEAAQRVLEGRYIWAEVGVIDPTSLAPPLVGSEGSTADGSIRSPGPGP